jgi:hypothetical protein
MGYVTGLSLFFFFLLVSFPADPLGEPQPRPYRAGWCSPVHTNQVATGEDASFTFPSQRERLGRAGRLWAQSGRRANGERTAVLTSWWTGTPWLLCRSDRVLLEGGLAPGSRIPQVGQQDDPASLASLGCRLGAGTTRSKHFTSQKGTAQQLSWANNFFLLPFIPTQRPGSGASLNCGLPRCRRTPQSPSGHASPFYLGPCPPFAVLPLPRATAGERHCVASKSPPGALLPWWACDLYR